MQRCKACGFHTLHDERVVDEEGVDRGSLTRCTRCRHVERSNVEVPLTPAAARQPGRLPPAPS